MNLNHDPGQAIALIRSCAPQLEFYCAPAVPFHPTPIIDVGTATVLAAPVFLGLVNTGVDAQRWSSRSRWPCCCCSWASD
jgi:hypothetical protein